MKIDKTLKSVCLVVGSTLFTIPTFARLYSLAQTGRQEIHGLFYNVENPMEVMNAGSVPEAENEPSVSVQEQGVAEAAALRQLIVVYGDADGSIESLAAQLEQVTEDTAEELFAKAAAKKIEVVNSYNTAVVQLTKLITRSMSYYEKWQDREGMDELKTAYETAENVLQQNSQEQTKNIVALNEAYEALYSVYVEKGGNSDPAQYVEDLKEQIAEAEKYQQKYNYLSLGQAIKEAKSYQNSSKTNELQAQTRALRSEIERTLVQYQSLVNRMDKILVETKDLLTKRYAEIVPENYKVSVENITDSLATAEVQDDGIERNCTDMEVLQKLLDDMKSMQKEVDGLWNKAVDILKKSLNDAVLKSNDVYPDNQELKDAIKSAAQKLKDIEALLPAYNTIASVNAVDDELEQILMKLEANERRNMANNFVYEYKNLEKDFAIYGSDENSVPTSNVKVFLEENKTLCTELEQEGLVKYTLEQLDSYYRKALNVRDAYKQFCDAAKKLDVKMTEGETISDKYYDKAANTEIDKALKYAKHVRTESLNLDSVLTGTYALQDSIMKTQRIYKENMSKLTSSRLVAFNNHNKYYGKAVKESEILDVYTESAAYISTDDGKEPSITNIFSVIKMTERLNECYKHAADSCAALSEKLQTVIGQVQVLDTLMENKDLSTELAQAINAMYAEDARINAVTKATANINVSMKKYTEMYISGVDKLRASIDHATLVAKEAKNDSLSTSAIKASELLTLVDPKNAKSTHYNVLISTADTLNVVADKVETEWKKTLSDVINDLNAARQEALNMHNLYYGSDVKESEILDQYNRAAEYLDSKDIEAVRKMIADLKASYLDASVKNSKSEASLKGLISRTTPLVTLMEDATIADAIAKAEDALKAQEARLKTLDNGIKALQPVYDNNAVAYDKAVVSLGDTIQESKDLLLQIRDEELRLAIIEAEEAFAAADKTSETATLYSELNMHKDKLAVKNAEIRDNISSGIEGIYADGDEVVIYNLQGVPVKKVCLTNKDAFNGLPAGIYVVNGVKIIIK